MKNSILILAVALVSFSTISSAKNTVSLPYQSFEKIIGSDYSIETQNNATGKFEKPFLTGEAEVFNPESVIAFNPKTIEEIITEGNKIVEAPITDDSEFKSNEESMHEIIDQSDLITADNVTDTIFPLPVERTIADEITEKELIIESTITNDVQSLDFKKLIDCTDFWL